MKVGIMSNEQFADWALRQAEAIENNGLRMERELYNRALEGKNREAFLRTNNIPDNKADEEWTHHIEWLRGNVEYLERKVRKYRKDAHKALQAM